MKQLTIGDILEFVKELKNEGLSNADISNIPVYLGDDEELNGIHTGWYMNLITNSDQDLVELINESGCNVEFKDKGLLIS